MNLTIEIPEQIGVMQTCRSIGCYWNGSHVHESYNSKWFTLPISRKFSNKRFTTLKNQTKGENTLRGAKIVVTLYYFFKGPMFKLQPCYYYEGFSQCFYINYGKSKPK
jgi:hypothetical protein